MESKTLKSIRSGEEYNHLFPKATLEVITKKKGATVSDTVKFIPKVVRETLWQTERIAPQLKGATLYETCRNIWHFLYEHVKYKKDEDGKEQVRSPARLWHDRFRGVDCDCFTTTVLSLLQHHNIRGMMRITKYKQNHFQHIYPIVPIGNGKYITMDCVVNEFNYEEPYTEKKDFNMDLEYLNGTEDDNKLNGNVDAQDLFGWNDEMGDLGKLFKRRQSTSAMPEGNQGGKGKRKGFQKFKNFAKKALNVVNKANPATALLRAGILASMKLNIMKVPQKLKWAYLSENEARQKGADMSKFDRLKKILYKMEQIFFTAGGKPENLRKAILTGRGNRNKEVNGLGLVDGYEIDMSGIDENSSLPTLLGASVYQDEFVNGLEGTEGLGSAVASGAAIASATTIMTAIAALLKSVGNLFPKKKNNEDFKEEGGGGGGETSADASESGGGGGDGGNSSSGGDDTPSVRTSSNSSNNNSSARNSNESSESSAPPATNESNNTSQNTNDTENNGTNGSANKDANTTDTGGEPKKGFKDFWENNKKWMKPLGIGLGAATVLFIGYKVIKGNKDNNSTAKKTQPALNGIGRRKRRKKTKGKQRGQHGKKSNVALM
jgi:hypothetical protein